MMASPQEMAATMLANLPEKTGKSADQWLALIATSGVSKHGEIVSWLKKQHGVTHGYANLLAHHYKNPPVAPDQEPDLVASQYAGAKAGLQPLYDNLIKHIEGFGQDVEIAPKKAYVSLRRNKQFAILQPSTKTRLDVGIQLKEHPVSDRLEASGSFNAMVSHRVRVTSSDDIDEELLVWLHQAYEQS